MESPFLRPRRDGWTPAAQAAFVAAREAGASIAAAAAAAGLSRQAAYKLRAHPAGGAVRAAWRRPTPPVRDAAPAAEATLSDAALLGALRRLVPKP